jgi:hypothetical protein
VKSLESEELSLEYHKAILLSNRYYKHQNDLTLGLKTEAHEMNDINHQIFGITPQRWNAADGNVYNGKKRQEKNE